MAYISHSTHNVRNGVQHVSLAVALWRRYIDWRRERRNLMLVSSLPLDLQKDIGWPDRYEPRQR